MRYTGQLCPFCEKAFTEEDDVVVCPECATPHHRSCWQVLGCCRNAEKHGTGFIWKPAETTEIPPEPAAAAEPQSLDVVCPDCGTVCPNGTLRCPECGAVIIPDFNEAAKQVPMIFAEVAASEDIDGVSAAEYAAYVGFSPRYYIKSFKRLASGKKIVFNIGAFLCSPYWFFLRKLYRQGVAFFLATVTTVLAFMPATLKFLDKSETISLVAQSSEMTQEAYTDYLLSQVGAMNELIRPLYFMFAILFVINLVAGFIATRLYYSHAHSEILRFKGEKSDDNSLRYAILSRGGVSFLAAAISFGVYRIIIYFGTALFS